jgi:hypothetical protein
MTVDEIINYNTSNLIKIYKLNQIGLTNEEIVQAMKPLFVNTKGSRGVGYVKSMLKEYVDDPKKIERANKIPD